MTDYEVVQLRLRCFDALRGHGYLDDDGKHRPLSLEVQCAEANRLAHWAQTGEWMPKAFHVGATDDGAAPPESE